MANGRKGSGLWIALLGAVAIAAAAAYFFLWRSTGAPQSSTAGTATPAPAGTAPAIPGVAPGGEAAQRTDLTIGDLLRNAGTAVKEGHLIEPAGSSAVDYYLLVLGRDANNAAAQEGLREMFSVATGEVEQKINAGQLDESRRAIDLLSQFDANNYTLTILRNKLDLKKKQMDRDQEKRDQDKALAANAGKNNPATPGTATPAASAPAPATDAKPAAAEAAKPAAATVASAKPVAAPAAPAAPAGETRAAVPISQPSPRYPAEAFRSRQEGWVEVTFTIAPDGSVKDGSVVGANPPRLFNSAALRGITDWKFKPRLENGQPVEQQVRTRIEFKLPDR